VDQQNVCLLCTFLASHTPTCQSDTNRPASSSGITGVDGHFCSSRGTSSTGSAPSCGGRVARCIDIGRMAWQPGPAEHAHRDEGTAFFPPYSRPQQGSSPSPGPAHPRICSPTAFQQLRATRATPGCQGWQAMHACCGWPPKRQQHFPTTSFARLSNAPCSSPRLRGFTRPARTCKAGP
jgi:hypothetical protein